MSTAGVLVIVTGIVARRHGLTRGSLSDRAIAMGRVFEAAPLATFGALHLAAANGLMGMIPTYMPWPLFWVYFVGFGLIATALSLIFDRFVRWSGLLGGVMFLLFVAMMDIPAVAGGQHDRFTFTLVAREAVFGCGLLALAGSTGARRSGLDSWLRMLVTPCRIVIGATAVFYGVEHWLHPEFLPGVPLEKLTAAWVPAPRLWGYAVGTVLVVAGLLIVANRKARQAAAWLGMALLVTEIFLYLPLLGPAHGTDQVVEAIDYIFDTMLFAGTALILGEALGRMQTAEGEWARAD
jgi:uncharacterized membrane protein YphA (DoxX/SURF4 family)